jgi:hypothetical protein
MRQEYRGTASILIAVSTLGSLAGVALAQPEPWRHPDGTIHWYNAVTAPAGSTWSAASDSALAPGGYLATLTSETENAFVFGLADRDSLWHLRPGPGSLSGPWLGGRQAPGSGEPADGWAWITGEPFDWPNWSPGEPDDQGGGENALHYGGLSTGRVPTWDDLADADTAVRGYVVELSAETTTVGLLRFDSAACPGYTLLAPMESRDVFLLDGKGRPVHSWRSNYQGAMATYLLEDGKLLRLGQPSRVELLNWDGSVAWAAAPANQHHDAIRLPSGNILAIASESRTRAQAIAAGRNPARLYNDGIAPDYVIEVDPATGNVVWEWHAWDHLVQQFDSTKPNYGAVSEHAELIDLNFGPAVSDWLHCNGLDYNAEFDQVIISVHTFGEFWVIDHGTTTEEARGHSGGRQGMGGDLLYRWGNPWAYKAADSASQRFWGQHNAQWIRAGLRGAGNILVFNNGLNRPGERYSTVEELTPPSDSAGRYPRPAPGEPHGPAAPGWVYAATPRTSFYSAYISGAQRLPNGNTLVCEGGNGRIFEVSADSQLAWAYKNPVYSTGRRHQGETGGSQVFRALRYPADYPGLAGRELRPGYPLELYDTPPLALAEPTRPGSRPAFTLAPGPNPARGGASIRYTIPAATEARLAIYDGSGRNVRTLTSGPQPAGVHTATWDGTDQLGRKVGAGVYLVRLTAGGLTRVGRLTLVR